jgi:thiol-disulfide isomerase/thioredoxin
MSRAVLAAGLALGSALLVPVSPAWPAVNAQAIVDDRLERLTRAFAALDARDLEGRRWTAATSRGRVVVLDFWATWCAPCLAEIPWLRRARETFGHERFEVLGVNLDVSDQRVVTAWLNRQRVDWPQLRDGRGYNGDLARQFAVTSLPKSLLVDRDGRVVAVNLRGERLLAAVGELLGS